MKTSLNGKIFLKGFFFSLPIALTIGILLWLYRAAESVFVLPLRALIPDALQFPGMGALATLIAVYLVGLAIHGRFLNVLFQWLELLLNKVPFFNVLYRNIKEMIDFISGGKDNELGRVVMVTIDESIKLIGFVTNSNSTFLIGEEESSPLNAVYIPMAYQMGGYVLYLPESRLETLNISTQEAMRRVLTAEISKPD